MGKNYGFNYQRYLLVDVTPDSDSPTMARVGDGIVSANWSKNEEEKTASYLKDNGDKTTIIMGKQMKCAISGDRILGDAFQDFVASKIRAVGDELVTTYEDYEVDGTKSTGTCVLTGISTSDGDAGAISGFAVTLTENGTATITPKAAASDWTVPAAFAAGTVTGTTKCTVTKTIETNTLAYSKTNSALTAYVNGYVKGLYPYVAEENIEAVADQYINMYELNSYGRVVKFVSHKVVVGEIATE